MGERGKSNKKILKLPMTGTGMTVLLVSIVIAIALTPLAVTPVMAQEAEVTVNAPKYVEEKETFDVTIDVDSVTDFNSAQFDLSFDHKVVKVEDVTEGSIDDTEIPIYYWDHIDSGIIKVISGFPEEVDTLVSGSGYLAKITFEVKGKEGDKSVLDISKGKLVKIVEKADRKTPEKISVEWMGAEITVGKEEEEEREEELGEEVTPGSPNITAWKPAEAVVSNAVDESGTFNITVNQIVDISWQINGTEVQTNESVTEAFFTKSAVAGTWNVSAIATNTTTGLSDLHRWIWSVTLTPTASVLPTPTPTRAPGVSPKPATPAVKPTPKPTATPITKEKPTPTPTPKPAVPGFEAIFAIAVLLAIAYILRRQR
jgi:PGF-CTERM protein